MEVLPVLIILVVTLIINAKARQKKAARDAAGTAGTAPVRKPRQPLNSENTAFDAKEPVQQDLFSGSMSTKAQPRTDPPAETVFGTIEDRPYDEGEDPCHEEMLPKHGKESRAPAAQETPAAAAPSLPSPGTLLSGIMMSEILGKPLALREDQAENGI